MSQAPTQQSSQLGKVLRWRRLRAGYPSQTALAAKLRQPRPYLSMLEAGRVGWLSQEQIDKLVAFYATLLPLDLFPLRGPVQAVVDGGDVREAVEEVFLIDPRLYAAARADVSPKDVARALNLSETAVRRFEACELGQLKRDKTVLLAVYYRGLADRGGPSAHIQDEPQGGMTHGYVADESGSRGT